MRLWIILLIVIIVIIIIGILIYYYYSSKKSKITNSNRGNASERINHMNPILESAPKDKDVREMNANPRYSHLLIR